MMKKLTVIEKIWNKGEKIYDDFASKFGIKYSTPRTNTLELFFVLKDKGEEELLLREMMTEFLTNLSDEEVVIENHRLYSVSKKLDLF